MIFAFIKLEAPLPLEPTRGILFTLIESCRRRGINPFEYLRDVLTRLPSMTNW